MDNLMNLYVERKKQIEQRLDEFKQIKEKDYFYELCFCILTPQSNGKKCWDAVLRLKNADFENKQIDPAPLVYPIRFYKNKSRYLVSLKKNYKFILNNIKKFKNIKNFKKIDNNKEDIDFFNENNKMREFLIENIKGYGYKEASHALRNIGFSNLAILDRHILKNLQHNGVIRSIPKTMTKKNYLEIEKKFIEFSKKIKIPMDHLDLLFWSNETGEIFK